MKLLTREWIEKAEGDFTTASREMRARKSPNYDAACFHAQQCAEKYLKALLQEAAIQFGKTHHLISLLELIVSSEPTIEMIRPQLQSLNAYAVSVRYPGESADRAMAKEALRIVKALRMEFRLKLGLDS
jgi:HEPN domain-containing protein